MPSDRLPRRPTNKQLREHLAARGVDHSSAKSKGDLLKLVSAAAVAEQPVANGEQVVVDAVIGVLIKRDPETGKTTVDLQLQGDVRMAEAPVLLEVAQGRARTLAGLSA